MNVIIYYPKGVDESTNPVNQLTIKTGVRTVEVIHNLGSVIHLVHLTNARSVVVSKLSGWLLYITGSTMDGMGIGM
jgi:hypothetical protein